VQAPARRPLPVLHLCSPLSRPHPRRPHGLLLSLFQRNRPLPLCLQLMQCRTRLPERARSPPLEAGPRSTALNAVEAAALAALQHSAPAPPPRDPNTIAAS